MDFSDLRNYIEKSKILPEAALKTDKQKKYDAIFFVDKPEELEADTFVTYHFNEISTNKNHLRTFVVELRVHAKDPLNITPLKENLISLLDFSYRPCDIPNFVKLVYSNDGGIYYDNNTGFYKDKLFFACKTL